MGPRRTPTAESVSFVRRANERRVHGSPPEEEQDRHRRSEVEASGERELRGRLRADTSAYFVHVSVPDEDVRFSDNHLELLPGEERTVVLTSPEAPLRAGDIRVRAR